MIRDCGEAADQFGALNQTMFFAPAVIYICMDKVLSEWSLYDIGAYSQSVMLAAVEQGLATIPAITLMLYPDVLRHEMDIPDHLKLTIGIAIGYADKEHGVVGSIFAAVGTALPETIIPIIAIFVFHDEKATEIGVGAIAGAPFMLSTLAFFVTGFTVIIYSLLHKRSTKMNVDVKVVSTDLSFFLVIYTIAVLTTFIRSFAVIKNVIAVLLLLSYILYVRRTISADNRLINFKTLLFCDSVNSSILVSITLIKASLLPESTQTSPNKPFVPSIK